jgi:hypothetical protein
MIYAFSDFSLLQFFDLHFAIFTKDEKTKENVRRSMNDAKILGADENVSGPAHVLRYIIYGQTRQSTNGMRIYV